MNTTVGPKILLLVRMLANFFILSKCFRVSFFTVSLFFGLGWFCLMNRLFLTLSRTLVECLVIYFSGLCLIVASL